jgi:endonuclease III-like uncharacterized protein
MIKLFGYVVVKEKDLKRLIDTTVKNIVLLTQYSNLTVALAEELAKTRKELEELKGVGS